MRELSKECLWKEKPYTRTITIEDVILGKDVEPHSVWVILAMIGIIVLIIIKI